MLYRHVPALDLPGPRGAPGIGVLAPFARDPLAFCTQMARTYGDMVHYRIVEHTLVQLNHPELVEQVLLGAAKSMHKDAIYDLLRPLLGNGLVTAEGEPWRRHRKLAAPSFTRRHITLYGDAMVDCTRTFLASLQPGERDVHADMMAITQAIVLRTLFGDDLPVDTTGVGDAIDTIMEEFVREVHGPRRLVPRRIQLPVGSWVLPKLRSTRLRPSRPASASPCEPSLTPRTIRRFASLDLRIPTPGRRRADQAISALDRQVLALIEERRARGLGDDLLSRLIAARDEDGQGFDDQQLRDEAVTMFVAGHETTALALTWTLVLLADHPEHEDRLRAEVDQVLGDRPATAADMARLPWTTAVLKEALRCLPPVWGIGREAQEDVEIGGHLIPAGTQLLILPWVLHHDRRWFDDPERFHPERWLGDLESRLPRMAWMPFGGGPRICIGNHFAMLEATLVLATLVQHLRFRLYGKLPPKLIPSITLRPGQPVRAHVTRRSP